MTHLTWIAYTPRKRAHLEAPLTIRPADVSLIIPVKDNQPGIDRFVAVLASFEDGSLPGEVIVVDNGSGTPVTAGALDELRIPVRIVTCERQGPAAARNEGARYARGEWLLFSDSDCIPASSLVTGYAHALNGAVGYAGYVAAFGADALSRYYESQDILVPPRVHEDRPQYLITANALVWRNAFFSVGGFDEAYPLAGGEDVDLGFRLTEIGALSYAPGSMVRHDFSDGYIGLAKRFYRYGRGNCRIARKYQIDLRPRLFAPTQPTVFNWLIAIAQFLFLSVGYNMESRAARCESSN